MNDNTNANISKRTVQTRLKAGAPQVKTVLTFDWTGMTPLDIREFAEAAFTVKWQGQRRKAKVIPSEATVKVLDHKVGTRAAKAPPKTLAEIFAEMSPTEQMAWLVEQQAKLAANQQPAGDEESDDEEDFSEGEEGEEEGAE